MIGWFIGQVFFWVGLVVVASWAAASWAAAASSAAASSAAAVSSECSQFLIGAPLSWSLIFFSLFNRQF